MVDVACAVEVARHATLIRQSRSPFRAIVMLSADRDLTPAYRMAVDEYGVALHVAAASIVDTREHPYLLLGQAALARMCEPEPAIYGHALRNAVARLACEPRARWTLVAEHRGQRGCLMRHASGALGWVPALDVVGLRVGETRELFSCGITGSEGRSRFPLVRLSAGPRGRKRTNGLTEAVVEQRLAPHWVRLRLADGSLRKAWCEIGGLVRGTEVLLQTRPSRRVIGCLDEVPPLLDGTEAIDLDTPRLVRILGVESGGRGIGIDEKGRRCTIFADARTVLESGRRIAVMPIDLKPRGRERLIVQAISSVLPPDR